MTPIERIEALLAEATDEPWEAYQHPVISKTNAPQESLSLLRTSWKDGQSKRQRDIPMEWNSPLTIPSKWHSFDKTDAELIAALRNAAPALVRLVEALGSLSTQIDSNLRAYCFGIMLNVKEMQAIRNALAELTKDEDA